MTIGSVRQQFTEDLSCNSSKLGKHNFPSGTLTPDSSHCKHFVSDLSTWYLIDHDTVTIGENYNTKVEMMDRICAITSN